MNKILKENEVTDRRVRGNSGIENKIKIANKNCLKKKYI